ncbi:MAG: hypothetical protein HC895_07165 [Leptolyngbyaceae cyanobacterium SM1_3_5]|nr:hypothetical protein [Leptolyngbyaceae cyanobacterium SM1_3_5]
MASDWNLGRLDLMILQSEVALLKIKEGNEAIIRSGVLGVDSVPFLLLQPSNQEVLTSLFFVDDARANAFPIPKICGDSEVLYAYVDKNRQEFCSRPNTV